MQYFCSNGLFDYIGVDLSVSSIYNGSISLQKRTLHSNEYLVSNNCEFLFHLSSNGNLLLRDFRHGLPYDNIMTGAVVWMSGTFGYEFQSTHLAVRQCAMEIVITQSNRVIWSAGGGGAVGECELSLSDSGLLMLTDVVTGDVLFNRGVVVGVQMVGTFQQARDECNQLYESDVAVVESYWDKENAMEMCMAVGGGSSCWVRTATATNTSSQCVIINGSINILQSVPCSSDQWILCDPQTRYQMIDGGNADQCAEVIITSNGTTDCKMIPDGYTFRRES